MTKELITRGWLRDALDKALSEDTAEPTPVQQFIAAILHGNTIEAPSEYRGSKYGKPDTAKRLDPAILDVLIFPKDESALAVRQYQPVRSHVIDEAGNKCKNRPQQGNIDGNGCAGIGNRFSVEFPFLHLKIPSAWRDRRGGE
jgi:hypothetical protein